MCMHTAEDAIYIYGGYSKVSIFIVCNVKQHKHCVTVTLILLYVTACLLKGGLFQHYVFFLTIFSSNDTLTF